MVPRTIFSRLYTSSMGRRSRVGEVGRYIGSKGVVVCGMGGTSAMGTLCKELRFKRLRIVINTGRLKVSFTVVSRRTTEGVTSRFLVSAVNILKVLDLTGAGKLVGLMGPRVSGLVSGNCEVSSGLCGRVLTEGGRMV